MRIILSIKGIEIEKPPPPPEDHRDCALCYILVLAQTNEGLKTELEKTKMAFDDKETGIHIKKTKTFRKNSKCAKSRSH